MTQAVIMLLFGGTIIKATLTDVFLRYVKEGLRPFLLIAGALLVMAAVMTLWHEWRPAGHDHHDGGHGHGHHEPHVGWLLILPVLAMLLISPPALGSYTAGQAGSVSVQPADTWVEVVGVYSTRTGTDPVNKAPIAYVEVKSWQRIPQPKQPYA
jgi:hypothetical protein